MIRKHAPDALLVVFETGPLATWFHRKPAADGLPAVYIGARHADFRDQYPHPARRTGGVRRRSSCPCLRLGARCACKEPGLTANRARSTMTGHISKRGDKRVRSRLYEAAILVLTRIGLPVHTQAHPKNTKRLLTKVSRLENQNVSHAKRFGTIGRKSNQGPNLFPSHLGRNERPKLCNKVENFPKPPSTVLPWCAPVSPAPRGTRDASRKT